jgi:hypothetical protein
VILHLTSMIIGEPHAVMKKACISVKGGTPWKGSFRQRIDPPGSAWGMS